MGYIEDRANVWHHWSAHSGIALGGNDLTVNVNLSIVHLLFQYHHLRAPFPVPPHPSSSL